MGSNCPWNSNPTWNYFLTEGRVFPSSHRYSIFCSEARQTRHKNCLVQHLEVVCLVFLPHVHKECVLFMSQSVCIYLCTHYIYFYYIHITQIQTTVHTRDCTKCEDSQLRCLSLGQTYTFKDRLTATFFLSCSTL